MIFAIGFHTGDVMAAQRLLEWIGDLGGCMGHKCVLVADAATPYEEALKCKVAADQSFDKSELIDNGHTVEGWIRGSNSLFKTAAQHCAGNPFFWLEPDAVPLKSGWADHLSTAYRLGGKPFMGALVSHNLPNWPNPYLEGNAVYPANCWEMFRPLWNEDQSWTQACSRVSVSMTVNTPLIQQIWGEKNDPPTFAELGVKGTSTFGLDFLRKDAVLFHRTKDGSLISLLRKQRGIYQSPSNRGQSRGTLVVRRSEALGDVLAATCVADKLYEQGWDVVWQSVPACHVITRRRHSIAKSEEPKGFCDINLDGVYERDPERTKKHFATMFLDAANLQLSAKGISIESFRNFAPTIKLSEREADEIMPMLMRHKKPWVMICPRSNAHRNRQIPDDIWKSAASSINGTCFWLGTDRAPDGIVDLQCRHMDRMIWFLSKADTLVSVDTGPMHIAAALGVPIVAIEQASSPELHLSDQRDFVVIRSSLGCLNCQHNVCPIDAHNPPCRDLHHSFISSAVNWRLSSVYSDEVSAAICCYKPNVTRLNKCISHVINQVNEVVVSVDGDGEMPPGLMRHEKIRVVRNRFKKRLGYGKNANHCVRHTNGKWVLLLNDDVYLNNDAVARMREVVSEKVGVVAQLLYYPDGTIQHGGAYRNPGDIGFGHIDHRARNPRITEPVEMENVTLASALVRRTAFYDVHGFDEEYDTYCEDTDLCMKMRQNGWKILYQPKAVGIHDESQTTRHVPEMYHIMNASNQRFGKKWGAYFRHNVNPGLGNFDYLK